MVTIPGFLLRRLYVKGSLSNSPEGVRFELKNSLGSGYAKGMLPVSIDGKEHSLEDAAFLIDGKEVAFSDVTEDNSFTIGMNKTIHILVKNESLEPGNHKIGMGFVVPGLGALKFEVKDKV